MKDTWTENMAERTGAMAAAFPEQVRQRLPASLPLPLPLPTADQVRAYLSESTETRLALAATSVAAAGWRTYAEYHRLNERGEACWAHLGDTYRTEGLAAWYKARHTGPCTIPTPEPPTSMDPPAPAAPAPDAPMNYENVSWDWPQEEGYDEADDRYGNYDDEEWETYAPMPLPDWALEVLRVRDLMVQAWDSLFSSPTHPLVLLLLAGVMTLWTAQLATAAFLLLVLARGALAAETGQVACEQAALVAEAIATARWWKGAALAAVETKVRDRFEQMKASDERQQARTKAAQQEALLRVLRAQEARRVAADSSAAVAAYDRCWVLLAGLYSLERAGLADMPTEEVARIVAKQWKEFDQRFAGGWVVVVLYAALID